MNTLDFTVSNFRSGGSFDNEAWAAFAQATYDLTDALHLTLGGRYTDEQKSFTPDQIIYQNYYAGFSSLVPADNPLAALDAPFLQAGGRILPLLEKDIDISEFTPMANLAFDLSDDIMVYLSYSEGFKSGGFTQRVFPPIVAPFTAPAGTPDIDLIPTYDPEFVEVLELGFKGTFMDGRVRVNGALFTTDYEDLQVQVFNSVAPVTQNIGEASIEGLELEVVASPGNGWFAEASLSLLDANYDEIDTGNTLIARDNDFERVPETAASLGLSRELLLGDNGTLILRGDWSYRSKTFNDAYNTALLETDSTDLIDASVRWLSADEAWTVTLSGINLTDEEYLVSGVYGTAFQSFEGLFDRGRELRLEVRRDFEPRTEPCAWACRWLAHALIGINQGVLVARVKIAKPDSVKDPAVAGIFEWVTQMEGSVPNHFYVELNFPAFFTAKLAQRKCFGKRVSCPWKRFSILAF